MQFMVNSCLGGKSEPTSKNIMNTQSRACEDHHSRSRRPCLGL